MVGMFWTRIQGFINFLTRMIILEVTIDSETRASLFCYLNAHARRLPLGKRSYFSYEEFVTSDNRRRQVSGEEFYDINVAYFKGKAPIFVSNRTIKFFRKSIDPDRLIEDATDYYNTLKLKRQQSGDTVRNRFRVIRKHGKGSVHARMVVESKTDEAGGETAAPIARSNSNSEAAALGILKLLGVDISELGQIGEADILDHLCFPESATGFIGEAETWLKAEHWYRTRTIPWRKGVLMTGPPGTGKTTFLSGVAQKFDLPMFSFDISSMSNSEFEKAFSHAASNAPCMVLIEDIDRVFHGDENIIGDMGGGLTLDCVLNCVAGAKPTNGVLTAITTNNPEHISSAIAQLEPDGRLSRPGRIDRIVHLGALDRKCRAETAERILDFIPEGVRDELVATGKGDTAAQFTDRCVTHAIKMIGENPEIIETSERPNTLSLATGSIAGRYNKLDGSVEAYQKSS